MKGFDVWDRAGYDMHGLPTEKATERELKISSRKEIENLGVDVFIDKCREWCLNNMREMNEEFKRIGVWMDFEDPYMSISKYLKVLFNRFF